MMKKALLFCLLLFFANCGEKITLEQGIGFLGARTDPPGKITGIVVDVATGNPLPGATIIIKFAKKEICYSCDTNGIFSIMNLPPGIYTVQVRRLGYAYITQTGVEVYSDSTTYLRFEMKAEVLEGESYCMPPDSSNPISLDKVFEDVEMLREFTGLTNKDLHKVCKKIEELSVIIFLVDEDINKIYEEIITSHDIELTYEDTNKICEKIAIVRKLIELTNKDTKAVHKINGSSTPKPINENASEASKEKSGFHVPSEQDMIDQILESMSFGNIAFNVPPTMNLNETAIIKLLLSPKIPVENLKQKIKEAVEIGGASKPGIQGASIRISWHMAARLSGTHFIITAVTPETQAVARNYVTEWKWEVKPQEKGLHHLHLTLSALVNLEGESATRTIKTFDKKIKVKVNLFQKTIMLMGQDWWKWFWVAILVPLFGWLWKRWPLRKRRQQKTNQ